MPPPPPQAEHVRVMTRLHIADAILSGRNLFRPFFIFMVLDNNEVLDECWRVKDCSPLDRQAADEDRWIAFLSYSVRLIG
jgi:hypothetical protein